MAGRHLAPSAHQPPEPKPMNKPATSRVTAVRTPGAPAAEEVNDTPELRAQMASEQEALERDLIAGGDTVLSEDPAPAVAPDIAALIAEGIRKGVAKALATEKRAATGGKPAQELPDQAEVDPYSIKKEVLTKQGYVMPAQFQHPAGLPQSMR